MIRCSAVQLRQSESRAKRADFTYFDAVARRIAKPQLEHRHFTIPSFQLGQEHRSLLLRSCLPHDLAAIQGLTLTNRCSGRAIRQQILHGERSGVCRVRIEGVHQCRPFLDDPDPGVAMTVDPSLVALGQAKPPLQIEIVSDPLELGPADEQACEETDHHRRHLPTDRVRGAFEAIDQPFELLLTSRAIPPSGFAGRGNFPDRLDVPSDRSLLATDGGQSAVDAVGQAAELLLGEPPFCASKLRRSESRTSFKASAIRRPGGWSGPPWSSLRMPRTAVP